ncbi:MAG: helix-turn-helix domain-containing protein [Myxococcaceae bacterium]
MSERAEKILQLLRILIQNETEIWLRQASLADYFECSRTTIWRALKQLKEANLITDLNKRYLGRYKTYSVGEGPGVRSSSDTHSTPDFVPVSKPKSAGQIERDEMEELLAQYGEIWQKQHPYFGSHTRPTLRSWVGTTARLGKGFRLMLGKSLPEWIEDCLNSRVTEHWAAEYACEQLALIRAAQRLNVE